MNKNTGFSLVEVTFALGLSAFCLTVLLGLIPAGLRSARSSNAKCNASDIATCLISDLQNTMKRTDPTDPNKTVDDLIVHEAGDTASTQVVYYSEQVGSTGSGHFSTSLNANARYRLSVTMQPPASSTQRGATNVHIQLTWPAVAKMDLAEGTLELFTALDRN
jgi:uncharacterized protein (TIGR02598 family)